MQSQIDLMELNELRELITERLGVYVEREVT